LKALAESAGATVAGAALQRRDRPDPALLLGRGKAEELGRNVASTASDLVIFDNDLTPSQQRNLETELNARVIDRTQLILDIFARHARTREGQLQVELAQLEYLLPRLSGHGIEMSRLGGGIGTRGPGETQLETDRRRIQRRLRSLRETLESVRLQRGRQREKREGVPLATVALVGYTNAGKSSLFNRLTRAEVLTSPRMFATLDPVVRGLELPSRRRVLLADTVGFLRNLPHGLISAFRATLEEVRRASLLLVVSDISSPQWREHRRQVSLVLDELEVAATPIIEVWNKCDLASPSLFPPPEETRADNGGTRTELSRVGKPLGAGGNDAPPPNIEPAPVVPVSARTGQGCDRLLETLDRRLQLDPITTVRLRIPEPAGRTLHLLYERGRLLKKNALADSVEVEAAVPESLLRQLIRYRA
jgi:GTP-binding protein HflX